MRLSDLSGAGCSAPPISMFKTLADVMPFIYDEASEHLDVVLPPHDVAVPHAADLACNDASLPGLTGPIRQLRLKSDTQHSTRIAFVEFEEAADAQRALRECSGALLGALERGHAEQP